jgi:hypothetical protein
MAHGSKLRRALRSWWIVLAFLPFGWVNWSAFLYAGLRARRRLWLGFAFVYLAGAAASVTFLALDPEDPVDTWREDAGAWIGIAVWLATAVHALVIRRPYLEQLDRLDEVERADDVLEERAFALELVEKDPVRARELGIGRPDLPGAYDGGLIDVNHASEKALTMLPGIDTTLAARAVKTRDEIGGFDSVLDFVHLLDLPPDVRERLEGRAVALPR